MLVPITGHNLEQPQFILEYDFEFHKTTRTQQKIITFCWKLGLKIAPEQYFRREISRTIHLDSATKYTHETLDKHVTIWLLNKKCSKQKLDNIFKLHYHL